MSRKDADDTGRHYRQAIMSLNAPAHERSSGAAIGPELAGFIEDSYHRQKRIEDDRSRDRWGFIISTAAVVLVLLGALATLVRALEQLEQNGQRDIERFGIIEGRMERIERKIDDLGSPR